MCQLIIAAEEKPEDIVPAPHLLNLAVRDVPCGKAGEVGKT